MTTSDPTALATRRPTHATLARPRGVLGGASAVAGLAFGALVLWWASGAPSSQSLVILGCSYALIALGMYIPFVLAGSLSLAYSAYAAIGAYSVAVFALKLGWPQWVGWAVAPLIAAAIATVLGLATKRLSGFFLGAVTLLFASAFLNFLGSATSITGGAGGLIGLPSQELFGIETPRLVWTGGAILLVALVAFLTDRVRLSPWGVTVRTLSEVPLAVDTLGVSVATMRVVAQAVGAAVATLSGSLFTASVGAINPETFAVDVVFFAIFMPIIGGRRTPWGAVAGAVVVTHLTLNVKLPGSSGTLLVALGTLVILLAAPRGLLGHGGDLVAWVRDRLRRSDRDATDPA